MKFFFGQRKMVHVWSSPTLLCCLNLLIGLITVTVLDKEKVFLMDNEKCIYFPCLSRRRSGFVLDNEKVFFNGQWKCIYFPLSVLQKKFGLRQPLSADSVRVLPATNEK